MMEHPEMTASGTSPLLFGLHVLEYSIGGVVTNYQEITCFVSCVNTHFLFLGEDQETQTQGPREVFPELHLPVPSRNMAAERINHSIRALDISSVQRYLNAPTRREDDPGFEVCQSTKDEWDCYVVSENQASHSRAMVWSNGKIYIVELPGWVYNQAKLFFREAMINSTQTGRKFLFPADSTYVESMDHIEPTIAFASRPESGAVLPAGLHWAEFHTLKVEIGVSQHWAQLNRSGATSRVCNTYCASTSRQVEISATTDNFPW